MAGRTVGGTVQRKALLHADGRLEQERAEDAVVDALERHIVELEQKAPRLDVGRRG